MYPMLGKECPVEVYAESYDEYCDLRGCINADSSNNRRDSERFGDHRSRIVDIQLEYDKLQPSDGLLSPEEVATIISGSVGLIDEGFGAGENELSAITDKETLLQKELHEQNEDHQRVREEREKEERDRAHSMDIDGVHYFQESYKTWRKSSATNKSICTPAPTTYHA